MKEKPSFDLGYYLMRVIIIVITSIASLGLFFVVMILSANHDVVISILSLKIAASLLFIILICSILLLMLSKINKKDKDATVLGEKT